MADVKIELYRDHFQNFKRYCIPKAQLVIADIPYNLGNNAYASNPMWYKDGDNANGESEKAGKSFFNTDNDFRIREDVDQPCKGRHIFKSFYVNDQGEFPEEKIGEFANACGVEEGKDFEPWELRLCTLRIVVREFTPEDKPDEKVTYVAYAKKSELEPIKTEEAAFSDVSEDDTPFK